MLYYIYPRLNLAQVFMKTFNLLSRRLHQFLRGGETSLRKPKQLVLAAVCISKLNI